MSRLDYYFILSLTVLFPFVSGLIRSARMSRLYRPFLILVVVAVVSEVSAYIMIELIRSNYLVINIYSLVECVLIIAQFYFWRYHSRTRRWYPYFAVLCVGIWIWENMFYRNFTQEVGSVFRVAEAFVLVILSINEINYLLINDSKNLLKNARFLICVGFLIYFLYQILLEGSIFISSQQQNNTTANKIIQVSSYINALVNIIYGIAIWFIPKKTSLSFKDRIEH